MLILTHVMVMVRLEKLFVLNNSKTAAYSTDGLSWTTTSMLSSTYWDPVCYGTPNDSPMFVAISNGRTSDVAAYSTDGINWSSATLPSQTYWYSVC